MSIVLISPQDSFENEVQIVEELLESGLAAYHFRKPNWHLGQREEYLNELPPIVKEKTVCHLDDMLFPNVDIMGFHLGESLREMLKIVPTDAVSTSFHKIDDLENKIESYSYAFLSPIFDSISDSSKKSGFEKEQLENYLASTTHKKKIFALGGIELAKLEAIRSMGFENIALKGAVWNSSNPVNSFLEVQTKWTELMH